MQDHKPVLYQEILDLLKPQPGGNYIDGTLGAGGHTTGLLTASAPDGRVLAFERDADAISFARKRLSPFGDRAVFVQASYAEMAELAPDHGFDMVNGIVLDLGLSSMQLADASRGFSFQIDGPLDMRFDQSKGQTAADLVNNLSEVELAELLWQYGEVKQSRRYARAIVRERPINSTGRLASLIASQAGRRGRTHPATQVFQALRVAVNDELGALSTGLEAATALLAPAGRLAVISFHSLEDRLVKRFIREKSLTCKCPPEQPVCTCDSKPLLRPINRKVIKPTESERESNPRSRSARLRCAEKVAGENQ